MSAALEMFLLCEISNLYANTPIGVMSNLIVGFLSYDFSIVSLSRQDFSCYLEDESYKLITYENVYF